MNNTLSYDIEPLFTEGINLRSFQKTYVDELQSTALMSRADAIAFTGGTGIRDGKSRKGQVYFVGTLLIGIGEEPVLDLQQLAIDNTIELHKGTPDAFDGPILAELVRGEYPGQQIYVYDAVRRIPAQGTGCWLYWDGADAWRFVSTDDEARTIRA